MKRRRTVLSWRRPGLVAALMLGAAHALAQPALPAEAPPGKSEKDQEIERFRCHEAAVKESRFNPRTAQAYVDGVYGNPGSAAPRQRGYFGRTTDPAVNMAGGAALGAAAGARDRANVRAARRGVRRGALRRTRATRREARASPAGAAGRAKAGG